MLAETPATLQALTLEASQLKDKIIKDIHSLNSFYSGQCPSRDRCGSCLQGPATSGSVKPATGTRATSGSNDLAGWT